MSKRTLLLSIITVAWNHRDEIGEFLNHVRKAEKEAGFSIEMVLVDNASSDGTADFVAEHYPWVNLVRNARNEGFAPGCNYGLQRASGKYLLMLNPDAFANGRALRGMIRFLKKNPSAGCVGCKLLHADGLPQMSAYAGLSPASYWKNHSIVYPLIEKVRKWRDCIGRDSRGPRSVGWLMGSCLMVPRRVYEKVGGLEPSFFMYAEDMDWCHQIRQAGWKVVFLPNYSIIHRQKGSSRRLREFCFRRLYRSIVHHTNRQFHEPEKSRILGAMLLDMYLRLPVYTLLSLLKPAEREAYRARLQSIHRMIEIIRARNPDLYQDAAPGS